MVKKALFLGLAALVMAVSGFSQYGSMSQRDVKDLVKDTQSMASDFENTLNKALDKSLIDDTSAEDSYKGRADDLDNHLDRAASEVDDPEDFRKHIEVALAAGFDIQKLMAQHRFPPEVASAWAPIRTNLNRLAEVAGMATLAAL